ncbi:DUF6069 family protein [Actinomadura parmotrematis]|uniref:SPW repeat-containing protein n=1 Tax=Actinomadura parmotrematis TaxID=2864039 RepID=A0ABS7G129_9ACTN|nr:DUF6069 family protein [Actinomadura parmotrematis]MBW8486191.1 hypothetical protein [Actinomadura parmotrematis]
MTYDGGNTYPMPPDGTSRTPPQEPPGRRRPRVNAARLWAGGVATAVVAAFVGVVGVLIARGILDIPVWLPDSDHRIVDGTAGGVALAGAIAGLAATAVMHLLLVSTPSPRQFFGWIVLLATLVAMLWPFGTDMSLASKLAGLVIAGVTGLAIWMLLDSVAASSVESRRPAGPGYPGYPAPR